VIAIIDYGAGNIRNVLRALKKLDYEAEITADRDAIQRAEAVILPGVGAAADTVKGLQERGLDDVVRRLIEDDRPFMGVCVGLQVLFDSTEEGGDEPCLGVLPGKVLRFPPELGLKVPHMGWNQVSQHAESPVFAGVPDDSYFYFVHSYYVAPQDRRIIAGTTGYGVDFTSAIVRGNLLATQFHPEKSGDLGLKIYDNFLKATVGHHSRH
jgi:imidazole glycerol-phosphate synthase subunit HisH